MYRSDNSEGDSLPHGDINDMNNEYYYLTEEDKHAPDKATIVNTKKDISKENVNTLPCSAEPHLKKQKLWNARVSRMATSKSTSKRRCQCSRACPTRKTTLPSMMQWPTITTTSGVSRPSCSHPSCINSLGPASALGEAPVGTNEPGWWLVQRWDKRCSCWRITLIDLQTILYFCVFLFCHSHIISELQFRLIPLASRRAYQREVSYWLQKIGPKWPAVCLEVPTTRWLITLSE